jgi:hypothetical protein
MPADGYRLRPQGFTRVNGRSAAHMLCERA